MKNMFPSRRPERGGTNREQGYWERMEVEGKVRPRRRVTDSQYSIGDVSVDSSHIARWNVARDIPKDQPRVLPHEQRVVPAKSRSLSSPIAKLVDRSWSWSPHKGSGDQISVTKLGGILQSEDGNKNNDLSGGTELTKAGSLGIEAEAATDEKQLHRRDSLRARAKARRRQRQSLRESGDFLGVQGINPHTGELDVMSPTDSSARSTISHQETVHSIVSTWRDMWRNNRHHTARGSSDKDEHIKGEVTMLSRLKREKSRVRDLGKAVRWKRRVGEWSSLQEPDLSPITQSLKSTSPNSREFLLLYPLIYYLLLYHASLTDIVWLIGRPSHAHGPQEAVQHLSLEEARPDLSLPNDPLTFTNASSNHSAASSHDAIPIARSSSNSTVIRTPRRQSIANPTLAS
jgi:hypothetical protein